MNTPGHVAAIIVAAGKGTRMGPDRDKLFLPVGGRPLVAHAWQVFDRAPEIDELIVVVRDGMQDAFQEIAAAFVFKKPFRLVPGGKERQDSVWNGLKALTPEIELVAIHDGARPRPAPALIRDTISAAREMGAAVAAQRVTDTLKESDGGTLIARTVDRSKLWAVQTPQTFRVEVIRKALAAVREGGLHVTDDTAACECIGHPVRLVESTAPNPKLTSPADLPFIEWILTQPFG
ncbi:MAG: 2-C-methyl-D-erythritol 4-phosphate cytidylyltransferase [Verrucomicrobiota bacterium]